MEEVSNPPYNMILLSLGGRINRIFGIGDIHPMIDSIQSLVNGSSQIMMPDLLSASTMVLEEVGGKRPTEIAYTPSLLR